MSGLGTLCNGLTAIRIVPYGERRPGKKMGKARPEKGRGDGTNTGTHTRQIEHLGWRIWWLPLGWLATKRGVRV